MGSCYFASTFGFCSVFIWEFIFERNMRPPIMLHHFGTMAGAVYALILPKQTFAAVDGVQSVALVCALIVGTVVYFTLGCYYIYRDEPIVRSMLLVSVFMRIFLCVA